MLSGHAVAYDATDFDAVQLEQSGLPWIKRGGLDGPVTKRTAGNNDALAEQLPKKLRARNKPLYPKNFDVENPGSLPDPERWLPKRERSTYRQRKRDKRGGLSRGPQGSTAGAADVKARTTTNMKVMSSEQKSRTKQEDEIRAKSEVAAAAALAGGGRRKGKTKTKW